LADVERLASDLRELIRIPSFQDSLGVSAYVQGRLRKLDVSFHADSDGNVLAEIGKGPGFLLNAHMDTVAPGDGWMFDPFAGVERGGKIYGRGASDCKAGIAAMLEIARVLKEEPLQKRVVLAFTAYEEGYPLEKNGVHRVLPRLKGIDKGLILEASVDGRKLGIIIGCRGDMRYALEIKGERGHSSTTPPAKNPIYGIPSVIAAIRRLPVKSTKIGMIGKTVKDGIMVTEVQAKEGGNVVPGKCMVTIDRRSLPGEEPGAFFPKVKDAVAKALGKSRKFSITEAALSGKGYVFPDREFLKLCSVAARDSGMVPKPGFVMGRVDGSILYNEAGIGTFMMGPGEDSEAHRIDESCSVEGLHMATSVVLRAIRAWDRE
jgi:acetylornithine deacetylase/succinyl-diaminopimelate desuccinylase-like protein